MGQPSKIEWQAVADGLQSIFGRAYMECDDYVVTLCWERASKANPRYELAVYVDGCIRGLWITSRWEDNPRYEPQEPLPDVTRRFYRLTRRAMYKAADIKKAERALGKRWMREHGYYAKHLLYVPHWRSVRSCIAHLKLHNTHIRVLSYDDYKVLLAQRQVLQLEAANG